jgi:hypothetical protein
MRPSPPASLRPVASLVLVALGISPALAHEAANISDPAGDTVGRGAGATDVVGVQAVPGEKSLELTVTYAAPPRSDRLSLISSSRSLAQLDPRVRRYPRADDRLTVTAAGDGTVSLRVHDFPVAVPGTVERPDPPVRVYRFRSPRLDTLEASVAQACLSGKADGDRFYGPWVGRFLKLTPALARGTVLQHLRARFGRSVGKGTRDWLACPPQQAVEPWQLLPHVRLPVRCSARAGRFASGTATALLAEGQPALGELTIRRVTRQSRPCPLQASTTVRGVETSVAQSSRPAPSPASRMSRRSSRPSTFARAASRPAGWGTASRSASTAGSRREALTGSTGSSAVIAAMATTTW